MTAQGFLNPPGEAAWRAAVARVLAKGAGELPAYATDDGVALAPLYPKGEALAQPCRAPGEVRIIQRIDCPELAQARAIALADLEGGASGLTLAFEGAAAARGFGLKAQEAAELGALLEGVYLDMIALRLEPAPGGVAAALQLAEVIQSRGLDAGALDVDFGFDPIGAFAARGGVPTYWKDQESAVVRACAALRERGFASPLLRADGRPYSEAGATEAEELASVLATGVAYLRALEGAGLLQDSSAGALSFVLVAGPETLTAIAKFRALRRLWALIERSCDVASLPLRLHAETSWRGMAKRDVYANVLRGAFGCAAAMIGGADSVTVQPFTAALGLPDSFARRLARNTGSILADESFLTRVADPAAGAGAIESLTVSLCEKAWELFQKLETAGGFPKAVASGFWQDTLAASRARRRRDVSSRQRPITGVSIFPNLGETAPAVLAPRRAPAEPNGAHGALAPERDAEPFERLRDRSDAWLAAHGSRPKIYLACLTSDAAARRARDFARGVFESGGFAIAGGAVADADALTAACIESGAIAACLCLDDSAQGAAGAAALRPVGDDVVEAARQLAGCGARTVVAGWPGEWESALRRAGVEDFIFRGGDVIAFLQRIWDRKPRP